MLSRELPAMLDKAQMDQLALCDRLEEIADSLPDKVDRQTCIHTARALGAVLARAHKLEEDVLFPQLEQSEKIFLNPCATLERLRLEHAGDACFVEELVEVLMSYGAGCPRHDAETTGYMLRGFFEALRRHIAFERELLSPLLADMQLERVLRAAH